jgi:hypothetical protein
VPTVIIANKNMFKSARFNFRGKRCFIPDELRVTPLTEDHERFVFDICDFGECEGKYYDEFGVNFNLMELVNVPQPLTRQVYSSELNLFKPVTTNDADRGVVQIAGVNYMGSGFGEENFFCTGYYYSDIMDPTVVVETDNGNVEFRNGECIPTELEVGHYDVLEGEKKKIPDVVREFKNVEDLIQQGNEKRYRGLVIYGYDHLGYTGIMIIPLVPVYAGDNPEDCIVVPLEIVEKEDRLCVIHGYVEGDCVKCVEGISPPEFFNENDNFECFDVDRVFNIADLSLTRFGRGPMNRDGTMLDRYDVKETFIDDVGRKDNVELEYLSSHEKWSKGFSSRVIPLQLRLNGVFVTSGGMDSITFLVTNNVVSQYQVSLFCLWNYLYGTRNELLIDVYARFLHYLGKKREKGFFLKRKKSEERILSKLLHLCMFAVKKKVKSYIEKEYISVQSRVLVMHYANLYSVGAGGPVFDAWLPAALIVENLQFPCVNKLDVRKLVFDRESAVRFEQSVIVPFNRTGIGQELGMSAGFLIRLMSSNYEKEI